MKKRTKISAVFQKSVSHIDKARPAAGFRVSVFPALLFAACLLSACSLSNYGLDEFLYRENHIDKRASSLKELDQKDVPVIPESKKYSVIIVTDLHYGAENSNLERRDDDFFKKIQALEKKPLFCISLGDIAEHGYDSEIRRYREEFVDRMKKEIGIETFTVVGNHDLYNSGWYPYSKYISDTSFYHFSTEKFSWYFLDNASATLGNHQFMALSNALQKDDQKKLFFAHVPMYSNGYFYFTMQNSAERNKLISLLANNNAKGFFCGHTHKKCVSDLEAFTEYTTGGYLAAKEWGLLKIDETAGSYSFEYREY